MLENSWGEKWYRQQAGGGKLCRNPTCVEIVSETSWWGLVPRVGFWYLGQGRFSIFQIFNFLETGTLQGNCIANKLGGKLCRKPAGGGNRVGSQLVGFGTSGMVLVPRAGFWYFDHPSSFGTSGRVLVL